MSLQRTGQSMESELAASQTLPSESIKALSTFLFLFVRDCLDAICTLFAVLFFPKSAVCCFSAFVTHNQLQTSFLPHKQRSIFFFCLFLFFFFFLRVRVCVCTCLGSLIKTISVLDFDRSCLKFIVGLCRSLASERFSQRHHTVHFVT